ncbi:MAG: S1-like domain-containing RNA-binding protein [Tunicatimonas sp.]
MLKIGNTNTLTVARSSDFGLYLNSSQGDILLPNRYVTEHMEIGQAVEVFVYTDSEDRLVAVTDFPPAQVGEFAALTVKDVTPIGAFLDWGLEKDLLLPFKEQLNPPRAGRRVVVRVCLDPRTQRVIAVAKLQPFFQRDVFGLAEKRAVTALVFQETDLGYKVLVDQRYEGLIYRNEVFDALSIGDARVGYVKKVRDDGKLDISLQPIGVAGIDAARETVLQKLSEADGHLPYHDKSDSQDIQRVFGLSKKAFKRAIGGLYKDKKIVLADEGIRLSKTR